MAWISTSLNTETVTFKDIGYSTTDATQAEIDFQVTKDPELHSSLETTMEPWNAGTLQPD